MDALSRKTAWLRIFKKQAFSIWRPDGWCMDAKFRKTGWLNIWKTKRALVKIVALGLSWTPPSTEADIGPRSRILAGFG